MKSFDFGGTGAPLHFLHANGYPPECYTPLLELLKREYRVFGMLLRPLWPDSNPGDIQDWQPFSGDLLRFLSSRATAPVIGVGHSMGAIVTLRAALQDPGKFRSLVLIDPVLFPPRRLITWNIIRAMGMGNKLHPKIAGSLKRRRTLDDLNTVFRGYRNREVFRYMSDENLRIYIEGITKPKNGGHELVYSPEWECASTSKGLQSLKMAAMNWSTRLNGNHASILQACATLIAGAICPVSRCQLSSCAAQKRIHFGRRPQRW